MDAKETKKNAAKEKEHIIIGTYLHDNEIFLLHKY